MQIRKPIPSICFSSIYLILCMHLKMLFLAIFRLLKKSLTYFFFGRIFKDGN